MGHSELWMALYAYHFGCGRDHHLGAAPFDARLAAQGRIQEAEAILEWIWIPKASGPSASPAPARQVSIAVLFRMPVLGRTLMGILVNIVIGFCLYGFINWLPTFFAKPG